MKLMLIIALVTILTAQAFGRGDLHSVTGHDLIALHSDVIFDSLVELRRDLYNHPEGSGREERTSRIIAEYLRGLGLEVLTDIGGYGVVGILHGNREGRNIAWRADIDAVDMGQSGDAETGSHDIGARHICGHDIHTAVGLGIATVLSNQKESLEGTVYFIFQPSEETFEGARSMMDDGLFDVIDPREIYGLHIAPMPAGVIAVKPHEVYANMRQIRITFSTTLDQEAIERIYTSVNQELSRVIPGGKPWELEHVLDPDIGMTNPDNMYRDYLIVNDEYSVVEKDGSIAIKMYFFETDKKNLDTIPYTIEEKIRSTEYGDRLESVEYTIEVPTVVNDPELTTAALEIITGLYGSEVAMTVYGQVPFSNDDFAYFQEQVPGVYFFLGGSNFEEGLIAIPHSPDYAVDEESIKFGVKYFSSLLMERVNR